MILEKDEKYVFSLKAGRSEINIPFKLFIGVIGSLFLLGLVKAARSL
jgi:hypothetical protein